MEKTAMRKGWVGAFILAATLTLAIPGTADAFCGFYVSQSEGSLYNNATRVAMMREGRQTVMSMQNNYAGPPEDFAMVVPVPEVLEKKRVKTLDDGVFDRLDRLTSPRLVEYWQQDPCDHREHEVIRGASSGEPTTAPLGSLGETGADGKVDVEARFDVGEYEVVVLSAEESTALDTWLRNHDYNIPDGAADYFRPYIEQGSYFFVAKVNLDKVDYENGEAVLSPLRFHYESDDFKLPVRLGLINSKGSQDLIAYLLADRQRYRVANYPNLRIPTNLPVKKSVKEQFGAFYDALFERLVEDRPSAVVTEYAWTATSCDPCPVEPLEPGHLQTLGADVIHGGPEEPQNGTTIIDGDSEPPTNTRRPSQKTQWTVTRLHTRYTEESLGEDLQFEEAPAIAGGRGEPQGREGTMKRQTARDASRNNFQARYYIRHGWSGEVDCEDPEWDHWGGPANGSKPDPSAAGDLGFRSPGGDISLTSMIDQETIPQIDSPSGDSSEEKSTGPSPPGGEDESPRRVNDTPEKASATNSNGGDSDLVWWGLLVLLAPLAAYGAYRAVT